MRIMHFIRFKNLFDNYYVFTYFGKLISGHGWNLLLFEIIMVHNLITWFWFLFRVVVVMKH